MYINRKLFAKKSNISSKCNHAKNNVIMLLLATERSNLKIVKVHKRNSSRSQRAITDRSQHFEKKDTREIEIAFVMLLATLARVFPDRVFHDFRCARAARDSGSQPLDSIFYSRIFFLRLHWDIECRCWKFWFEYCNVEGGPCTETLLVNVVELGIQRISQVSLLRFS